MANPRLSIITINLNNSDGIRKTIESVVNQTFTDYEFVVIDGGSTDGSVDVIKEYKEKIAYWISEPDKGIYNAMNKGILHAGGEYLQFLNSGDCLHDENTLAIVFEKPRTADIIYGHLNNVYEKGNRVHKVPEECQISLIYFFNNTLAHPSVFFARRLFENGMYDETYRIGADKKFLIEKIIFQDCTLQNLDEVIVNFNTKGISSRPENKGWDIEENDRIFASLFPPRIVKDYEFYKSNFTDIMALTKIKGNRLSYFAFKAIKKFTRLYEKRFRP
jgi:glycosyltransferase involved in cell wall biosynthesis